ncbi:MAG TPA: hypothetical protein DD435_07430 [Cyanobacteria bacterium UBA8530]|nr:hypothetical protein [Cyanobacteria bacterium UBA8530]
MKIASQQWFRPTLMDRYMLSEVLGPFLFGVASFTGILTATSVLFNLITLMVRFGIPLSTVLQVLALRMPEMAFYTFPMSMLLAALLSFGRLSGDSEIIALRASGVSLYRILSPVIVAALSVSVMTIALNEFVVPQADWAAKNLLFEAQHQRKLPTARDNVFYEELEDNQLKRFFYARHFDGETMRGVLVQEFEKSELSRIVKAESAVYEGQSWVFKNGTLYQLAENGEYKYVVKFERQVLPIKQALLTLSRENRQPMEMNIGELSAHIKRLEEAGHQGSEIRELAVQLHQKLSVPFASLVFALVGAPLGLRPNRSSGSLGLGLSILIIFVYYVAMFVFMAFGQSGFLSPAFSAWLPNVLTAFIGCLLIYRAAK